MLKYSFFLALTLFSLNANAISLELNPNLISTDSSRCTGSSSNLTVSIKYDGQEVYNSAFPHITSWADCNAALVKIKNIVDKAKLDTNGVVLLFTDKKIHDWNWILASNRLSIDEIMRKLSDLDEKTDTRLKRLELRVFGSN